MSLWTWALQTYALDGVPEACLALQDEHGQNTPFLLWAIWAETADPDLLARAAAASRAWDAVAVRPLRGVRRAMKASPPPFDDDAREALRENVKAAELHAERVLLETLAEMSGHLKGGAHALDALRAAAQAWGAPVSDEALAVLAEALH
jgi:uncharacterized protein (TIGR02444 family)